MTIEYKHYRTHDGEISPQNLPKSINFMTIFEELKSKFSTTIFEFVKRNVKEGL